MSAPMSIIINSQDPKSKYPILGDSSSSPSDDTYTREEIDNLLVNFKNDLKAIIDDVIVMSDVSAIPNPDDTSLWLEVVDEDVTGDFTGWYNHNKNLD